MVGIKSAENIDRWDEMLWWFFFWRLSTLQKSFCGQAALWKLIRRPFVSHLLHLHQHLIFAEKGPFNKLLAWPHPSPLSHWLIFRSSCKHKASMLVSWMLLRNAIGRTNKDNLVNLRLLNTQYSQHEEVGTTSRGEGLRVWQNLRWSVCVLKPIWTGWRTWDVCWVPTPTSRLRLGSHTAQAGGTGKGWSFNYPVRSSFMLG